MYAEGVAEGVADGCFVGRTEAVGAADGEKVTMGGLILIGVVGLKVVVGK